MTRSSRVALAAVAIILWLLTAKLLCNDSRSIPLPLEGLECSPHGCL